MNSGFSDPNNHVPEVTPDDDWGDSDSHVAEVGQPTAVLPPRRSVSDKATSVIEGPEVGLRIDTRLVHDDPMDESRKLKVQEINGSVVRLEQEGPAPARVDRILTFHEKPASLPGSRKPQGESKEWGQVHRGAPKWVLGMGAGVLGVVVLGIVLLPAINAPNAGRRNPANELPVAEEEPTSALALQMNELLLRQLEAMRIYGSFSHAKDFEEFAPFIRNAKAVKDSLRENWKPLSVPKDWIPPGDAEWSVMELGGHACGVLEGLLPDQSKFTAYFTSEKHQLRLDWKATVGYGTASFAELQSGPCNAGEIRGVIDLADFYTSIFPEATYQSLRLTSPDGKNTVWCYALKNSEGFAKISRELKPGSIITEAQGPKKITLSLDQGPEGALPNQWLVGEVFHLDWLTP